MRALTFRGEQGPLVLGLGVVVAVENQILHDLPVGLRGGTPVQPDGGRCQGAQAQVGWGCRGPWVSEEETGRGRVADSPSCGHSWEPGHEGMASLLPPLLEQTTKHEAK